MCIAFKFENNERIRSYFLRAPAGEARDDLESLDRGAEIMEQFCVDRRELEK